MCRDSRVQCSHVLSDTETPNHASNSMLYFCEELCLRLFQIGKKARLMTFEPLHCFIQTEAVDRFGLLGAALKLWRNTNVFKIHETALYILPTVNSFWIALLWSHKGNDHKWWENFELVPPNKVNYHPGPPKNPGRFTSPTLLKSLLRPWPEGHISLTSM